MWELTTVLRGLRVKKLKTNWYKTDCITDIRWGCQGKDGAGCEGGGGGFPDRVQQDGAAQGH